MTQNDASIQEARRVAFEAWAEETLGLSVRRNPSGAYNSFGVYAAWEAWNAVLDSVVVELPQRMRMPDEDEFDGDYESYESAEAVVCEVNRAIGACKRAIEAAGIKVKS